MWYIIKIWENKGWINETDPYGWFQWYIRHWLLRRSKMMKGKLKDGKEL